MEKFSIIPIIWLKDDDISQNKEEKEGNTEQLDPFRGREKTNRNEDHHNSDIVKPKTYPRKDVAV